MTEAAAAKTSSIDEIIRERIDYQLNYLTRQGETARKNVAENASSDWSLMEGLAESYGWQEIIWQVEVLLEKVDEGKLSLQEALTKYQARVLEELLRVRVHNSTSGASNLISTYKLAALQQIHKDLEGWLIPLRVS